MAPAAKGPDAVPAHHPAAAQHTPPAPPADPPHPALTAPAPGPARLADSRFHGRGNGPVRQLWAQRSQQTVGNRATRRHLAPAAPPVPVARHPAGAAPAPVPVQRRPGPQEQRARELRRLYKKMLKGPYQPGWLARKRGKKAKSQRDRDLELVHPLYEKLQEEDSPLVMQMNGDAMTEEAFAQDILTSCGGTADTIAQYIGFPEAGRAPARDGRPVRGNTVELPSTGRDRPLNIQTLLGKMADKGTNVLCYMRTPTDADGASDYAAHNFTIVKLGRSYDLYESDANPTEVLSFLRSFNRGPTSGAGSGQSGIQLNAAGLAEKVTAIVDRCKRGGLGADDGLLVITTINPLDAPAARGGE